MTMAGRRPKGPGPRDYEELKRKNATMDINENVNSANRSAIRIFGALYLSVGVIIGLVIGKLIY